MKFKGLKILATAAVLAAILTPSFSTQQVKAASTTVSVSAPIAYINSDKAYGEVLVREGNIFVTLTDLKGLGDYNYQYDKVKKQVSITGKGTTVIVSAGSKTIQNNGNKQPLKVAPFLHKGKMMIPLRAVADAFNAKVYWNGPAKAAYVTKPRSETIADLKSKDLSTARNAAITVPHISKLPQAQLEMTYMEMQGMNYYFPKGKWDKYFILDNDLASYYEIHNNTAELKWQAKLGNESKKHSNLFFLTATFKNEIGTQPNVKNWTIAQFIFRYPVGATYYGLINSKGTLASGEVELDNHDPSYKGVIVEIPEESGSK
ncbi:copper amine oxidase N-terminal domain-containing protein [Paenibacillus sp. N3/727]|uniref:stalk domain-containing protein n=1 Tax=Paenibacillus sp. N3/727 TaxID=2925845 RepID=UPI001F53E006|nr:stalk domain-containing protein [Paenibacillus sp. N3/727]UNK17514.1 copper amine oxidase N-terminal domain-containing protein [Paenibacillus sp. N3/727]